MEETTENRGLCNSCNELVPARRVERDGKVFLVKKCAKCGETETLISTDARRCNDKHAMDVVPKPRTCLVDCLHCRHKKPSMVFVDITNRCNLNCPICINNTPSMGFLFEPPLEYFEKIFKYFGSYEDPPGVQLFGGEPTVRKDLFEIIRMARSYGLPTRVVTNGLKLADEEYCRKLIESRATILIAYDGPNPETYRILRGSEKALELKLKALENIRKIGGAKVVLMTLAAKGFNDRDLPDLLKYVHERRDHIRGIYFMPLAHTWHKEDLDLDPERITGEDVENIIDRAFPEDRIDFMVAGLHGLIPTLSKVLRLKPWPFAGAHPNCESVYYLISDGEKYVPLSRYLKGNVNDLVQGLIDLEKRVVAAAPPPESGGNGGSLIARLRKAWFGLKVRLWTFGLARRQVQIGMFLQGRGPGKLWHVAAMLVKRALGYRSKGIFAKHSRIDALLQLIVLPFEDKSTLETDRLARCPTAFAFLDPKDDEVKFVPVCAWPLHKKQMMRAISEHYATTTASVSS